MSTLFRRRLLPFVCCLVISACAVTAAKAGDKPPAVSTWEELDKAGWKLTRPPYPYTARAKNEQGSGLITLATDDKGKVVKAEMTKKIGYADIDDFVVQWALKNWQGPPNAQVTAPIAFRVQ